VVIAIGWSRIMDVELERLDTRLCMEAKRIAPILNPETETSGSAPINPIHLSDNKLTDDLIDKLRIASSEQLRIFVESSTNGVLIQSDNDTSHQFIETLTWTKVKPSTQSTSHQNTDDHTINVNNQNPSCLVASFEYNKSDWRASLYSSPNGNSFLAVDIASTTQELENTLREALIVVIPLSLLLSVLGSWFIATNTIRPLNRLHKSMDLVTQKDFSHRLPVRKEDKEFKRLTDAYNTMLERLEKSFHQATRFTADAAHELRTPLTILRGKLEQAVISENTQKIDLNEIMDDVGNLSAITRKLLILSQADSGFLALHHAPINITDMLDELIDDLDLLSDQIPLHCHIDRALTLNGDGLLLKQLFNNLLSNAIRYSRAEEGIVINAQQIEQFIDVKISNHCAPISQETRLHLFDRFYRGELDRIQGISGSGLGLSLAREIARAHGGDLVLEPSADDVVAFSLRLPI
jgi:signal transduction histidine kinase